MNKKLAFLFLTLVCFSPLLLTNCSDDEDDVVDTIELNLEKARVYLSQEKSIEVNIKSGNGNYKVTSSDNKVATASISGDVITITATSAEERAGALITVTDQRFKRTTIDVEVAKLFDLKLNTTSITLELGVTQNKEATVEIEQGNWNYQFEKSEGLDTLIRIDDERLESAGIFKIKALALGTGTLKIRDSQNKEATINISITKPSGVSVNKSSITLDAIQSSDTIFIKSGNGNYRAIVENPRIAKAIVKDSMVIITGKINGETKVTIEDAKNQTASVNVTINGAEYAIHLSNQYFCFANFREIALVDESLTKSKQVTFEMVCKIDGYRGLQTFMGLEGRLIIRGKYDSHMPTHPIEISGLGDRLMLESTSSFPLDQWIAIALVVDCDATETKDKYKLYINGAQDPLIIHKEEETHKLVDLGSSNDGDRFEIGRAFGQDFRALHGAISDARVWTIARTEQEIKANLCKLTEENPTGLLAHWAFSAGTATNYIQDISGSKYESNLIISKVNNGGAYTQATAPKDVFVAKGCPQ